VATHGSNDEIVTYRVAVCLPVIVWDAERRGATGGQDRWGVPGPRDWRRPRPIHARSEPSTRRSRFERPSTLVSAASLSFRTFNEGEEVVKPSGRTEPGNGRSTQGTVSRAGFAFVWRRFEISIYPRPCWPAFMATVPANELIRRTIKVPGGRSPHAGDPGGRRLVDVARRRRLQHQRRPRPWMRDMEGVNGQAAPEPKKPRPRKP